MDELTELEATVHPSLNVYRWWRPDITLPALYNWLTPGTTETPPTSACRVRDVARIAVSIAIDPTIVAGEGDMLELEAYLDAAVAVLDPVLFGRNPLGVREAYRRGFQMVDGTELFGGVPVLILEIPLEVYLEHNIDPA